jgi:pimeloyl-ACP methyl ester carboxylesterase
MEKNAMVKQNKPKQLLIMKRLISFIILLLIMEKIQAQKEMTSIERDHVKIAYELTGKGDTTLLFVHGSFIDMNYWLAQVNYFKQQYQVLTIDLPGHGKSGKNRTTWTIQEYGLDVCAVIKELHLKNIILIGHSMGGDIILEAAAKCPDSVIGFVGVDNFKNAATPMSAEMQNLVDQIMISLKSDFANTSENFAKQALLSPSTDKAIAARVVTEYRNMDKNIGIDIIYSAFTFYKREQELMTQLKLKMYLINVDNIPTNEESLKKYAAAGYEILPIKGTCHFPMIEKPDEFNQLLQSIIVKINNNH